MYLIPADRLPGSPFISREPTTVSKRKHREKKRDPYADARKIRKHHPYEEWLKLRKKMDEADPRKKTETNVFTEFLSRVIVRVVHNEIYVALIQTSGNMNCTYLFT